MSDDPQDEISQQLERLDQKAESLFQRSRLRSALSVARETTQLARSHRRVGNYMRGLFDQMRFGHGLLDPQLTRRAAIELISLLESEEQARRIQPDLDEQQYHWICSWMSSCAYDNLAEATALLYGYNSPGLHDCITDGIQVCRRTGKLDCVKCFREYASDVYLAADDLEMVRHQCQALLEYRGDDKERKDRRWSAHQKLAWIAILEGRLDSAAQELTLAAEYCRSTQVYLKYRSQLLVLADQEELSLLLGTGPTEWPSEIATDDGDLEKLPESAEWPRFELERAKLAALAQAVNGRVDQSIEMLTDWDRRLTQQECRHEWFEIRLRLIAAYRMAGQLNRAQALAKGLDAQAREAQDYLTLRRLARVLDSATAPSPLPTLASLDRGPFKDREFVVSNVSITPASPESAAGAITAAEGSGEPSNCDAEPPLQQYLTKFAERLVAARSTFAQQQSELADDAPEFEEVLHQYRTECQKLLAELLAHELHMINDPRDAAKMIHFLQYLIQDEAAARRGWDWSRTLLEKFDRDAVVISVVAALGRHLRSIDESTFREVISGEDLAGWYRKSLQLDPQHARNHLRAGEFFRERGELGEAERTLARAFRLDRGESAAVLALSQIYLETDRPRDSLNVLDLYLREGGDDPQVAWEAGVQALNQGLFDAVVAYMDRHLELTGVRPWLSYYRAWGLLETRRFEECLAALDQEADLRPESDLHLKVLRVCALTGLGREEAARSHLDDVLNTRISTIGMLSTSGFVRLFSRLWKAVSPWKPGDARRATLIQRLLETGLTPDEYFVEQRSHRDIQEGVNFYRVRVRQPLDDTWAESHAPLPGQLTWTAYFMEWGVLASSEESAQLLVLEMQSQCYPLPAEIAAVELVGEDYRDQPGIVWQGYRWPDEPNAEGTEGDD